MWETSGRRSVKGLIAALFMSLSLQASAVVITSTDVPKAIPDLGTATSTLTAPNLIVSDLNLIIDDLRHTAILDLAFELTSPSGTTKLLIASYTAGGILSSINGFRVNLIGTILDDEAPVNLLTEVATASNSPFPGRFNINHSTVGNSPLSVFDGENAAGTWTLRVLDQDAQDSGTLNGWSIELNAAPEPGTLALLGLGLAGLAATRRRKR